MSVRVKFHQEIKSGSKNLNKISDYQKQVDEVIREILNQLPQSLHKDVHYLFKGKRVRSHLMFALGSKLGCRLPLIVLPAAGVEIIHTISLIHDDVIDQEIFRRGQSTLHSIHGNRVTVFIGDFLLQCLGKKLTGYRYNSQIIDTLYQKVAELCRGELLQDIPIGIISPGRQDYLQMIRKKTGSLFSYSFMVPTLLFEKKSSTGVIEGMVDFAKECGYLFGLGFQLADDIADLEEDMEVIRNEKIHRGDDAPERLFTYPILLWQEIDTDGFKNYLQKPSTKQLQGVRKKICELIYTEISQESHLLEIKSQRFKSSHVAKVFDLLQEGIENLFKK